MKEINDGSTRCNNCYIIFKSDDDLLTVSNEAGADGILVCPHCMTDEYLMQPYMQ